MKHYNSTDVYLFTTYILQDNKIIPNIINKTLIVDFFAETLFGLPYRTCSLTSAENTPRNCSALAMKKLENHL